MAVKAKEFRYAVELQPGGELHAEDGTVLVTEDAWTPEHLLLAALVRCSLKSFCHHAARHDVEVPRATGSARALFTRREGDGRYALVECDVELDLTLVPLPGDEERAKLIAAAERDCFIGASLTASPTYRWTIR